MPLFDPSRGHQTDMPSAPDKPELLAPAGDFEKLEIAVHYGADAVYIAGKAFSLRNFSGNFSDAELTDAVAFARQAAVKVYIACNIYPRNSDLKQLGRFVEKLGDIHPDAVIISDPGVFRLVKKIAPHLTVHLSTQANTTNRWAAEYWRNQGVKRINLARELSLEEIKEIAAASSMETEVFIHGAMCVSYSGRCLLSSYFTSRDSNRGQCSHPCRWRYALVEEQRPGEYCPVMEDERGSYILNANDLCMIGHIPELVGSGVSAFKIEGRMKGINYLATVLSTYRQAVDAFCSDPENYAVKPEWIKALASVYHRTYSTGFYFTAPDRVLSNVENSRGGTIHSFIGKITKKSAGNAYTVEIKNKLSTDDTVEILSPGQIPQTARVKGLMDTNRSPVTCVHPNTTAIVFLDTAGATPLDIMRKPD